MQAWLTACAASVEVSDDSLASAQGLGLPPEALAQLQQQLQQREQATTPQQPTTVSIWPCVWLPLQVFMAMGTQWTEHGLRLEALPFAIRSAGLKRRQAMHPDVLADLRVMEGAALDHWARERDTQQRRLSTLH